MAKGRDPAQLAAGIADLSQLRREELPDEIRDAAIEEAEVRLGLRCVGCRSRVKSGFKVLSIEAALVGGQPAVDAKGVVVCVDPECGEFLARLRDPHAIAVQKVSNRFLDDDEALAQILGGAPAPEPDPVAA